MLPLSSALLLFLSVASGLAAVLILPRGHQTADLKLLTCRFSEYLRKDWPGLRADAYNHDMVLFVSQAYTFIFIPQTS